MLGTDIKSVVKIHIQMIVYANNINMNLAYKENILKLYKVNVHLP